ncbi:MAG: MFS transporter [Rhodospirillales bacterium]|nr:MFS transporter [Rhodospirillales bacterium]
MRAPSDRLASRDFLLLWAVGGIGNAMRWLEVLAAALFTLDATGSELAVAVVSAARSLPLIFTAAIAGVLADAVDRRLIVAGGLLLSAGSAGAVALLAAAGTLQPWHLFVAGLASGLVYGTDLSARRRMLGESVVPALAARAVALDSLTGAASRLAGPLLGGAAYEWLGLAGTFAASALLSLVAALAAARVRHAQQKRRLSAAAVVADLAEAVLVVRRSALLLTVVVVTVGQNLFGFAYTSLVAPAGRDVFGVSAVMVGVLAAAEPAGGILGGLALALLGVPRGWPIRLFMIGSAWFLGMLGLVALMPWFWGVAGLLFAGGLGLALFSNEQTTIALTEAPEAARSRVMGLVTTAIGGWPVGMVLAGWLADRIGPLAAMSALGVAGLVWIGAAANAILRAGRAPP